MEQAAPAVKHLAQRLLSLDTNRSEHTQEKADTALRAVEQLRSHLVKLVGLAGFQALLARALALAKREVGWLEAVRIRADATLEGFSETAQQQSAEIVVEGSVTLLAQILGLLVTFIGEALTLRLVGDIWPETRVDSPNFSAEDTGHE